MVVLDIFYVHPENWGNDPIWRAYVSNGLKPPTRKVSLLVPNYPWWRSHPLQIFQWKDCIPCASVVSISAKGPRPMFKNPKKCTSRRKLSELETPNVPRRNPRRHSVVLCCFPISLDILPRNLTWNLNMMVSKRNFLFWGLPFRFHVKFRGCNHEMWIHLSGPPTPSQTLRNDIDVGDALNELKIAHDKRPLQSSSAVCKTCWLFVIIIISYLDLLKVLFTSFHGRSSLNLGCGPSNSGK